MPKQIEFSVVYVTDEDPKFKANELNNHGPTVKGWQSQKNCDYPQEIIIQLAKRCYLSKIQLLMHQYLIPSKVELFASNEDTNTVVDVNGISWDYLGYVTLSDNQSTGFKSRELKSANVPTTIASFLKLKLSKNHNNTYNIHNQVSLIAINILGIEKEMPRKSSCGDVVELDKLDAILNDPDYVSPYDDLAFDMYVDVEVARIIREMELKKHVAVINERFEYARKLKQAMEQLKEAGGKLGKYELEKRHAIELEDYERASHKKNQMDEFRTGIYQQLNIDQLLEMKGICPKNDEFADETDKQQPLSPSALRIPDGKRSTSPSAPHIYHAPPSPLHKHQSPKTGSPSTGSPTNLQHRNSFRRRNKSAGSIVKSTYEQYEEKPLPTLRQECQMDIEHRAASSKLTEREKKQAALPILVFGAELVEKFYSKHYLDKEEGLNCLKDDLLAYDHTRMHTANKTGRAAIFLLHRALRDKVFSVYNLANEVIRLYFVQYIPGRVSPAEVSRSVDKLLPELLTKSGDTSARIHHMAVHTILTMADCKDVRALHLIPVHLSRPITSSTHPRLALSRAEMVEQLIINQGISTDKQSGLTCRTLSEFGSSGIHHPAEAVRKVAERILVLVYKVNPRLVRKQLPPDDDITRRNLLYRQLFHEFDKIDVERKKELLERNRLIQQCSISTNPDCTSPEPPVQTINKCQSSSNIASTFSYDQNGTERKPGYQLTKSISGGNIVKINMQTTNNGDLTLERHNASSGISTPSNSSQRDEEEKHCIFCGQSEASIFQVSNSMNSHYWRSCPMLVRCRECSQVVEVASLTDHLLMECENRDFYTQCSSCTEAVKVVELQIHALHCSEIAEGCNRCPLCHDNLEDEEFVWKHHLMGDKPCAKSTRTRSLPKQVKIKL
ncbi:PREDICTED: centrosomal protein of 104 kDa isoform X2 [Nicrophorus vespilloides]|uniref:Centrosomal protein of 104 kDa isoform X2 n=1 Tax=Nicrophorus vespilloides TaxID=110193 RepID=A0ABM1MGC4_NICVS|nr:PREDICTED: centrosomal protein of 104 kDa isoform X2 [Nicrophorus vespilloides]